MTPEQDSSPELEALVLQGEDQKESLNNVESNTEATAFALNKSNEKLEDIDSNMEARLVQAESHINKLAPSIESMGKAMKTVDTLLTTLRGPQGEKGDKGEKGDRGEKGDKGADSVVPGPKGKDGVNGKDGKDGVDGMDGKDGKDGVDGSQGPAGKDGKDGQSVDEEKILKKLTKGIDKEMDGVKRYVQGSKTVSASEIEGLAQFVADNSAAASISDTAYGPSWDGDTTTAPSKNAVYDKIETLGGGGDVVGPASATDNAVARFDATTGKLIQNSAMTVNDAGAFTATDGSKVTGNEGGGFGYIVQAIENTS